MDNNLKIKYNSPVLVRYGYDHYIERRRVAMYLYGFAIGDTSIVFSISDLNRMNPLTVPTTLVRETSLGDSEIYDWGN